MVIIIIKMRRQHAFEHLMLLKFNGISIDLV
jgi:hypothetical protein